MPQLTQLERLISRLVQIVEDSPSSFVQIAFLVDKDGAPIAWEVSQKQAEGLQKSADNTPCNSAK